MSQGEEPRHSTIVGRNPVLEALKAQQPVEKIFIQHGTTGPVLQEIRDLARRAGVPVAAADKSRIEELAGGSAAQGVVALRGEVRYADVEDLLKNARSAGRDPFLLVLDEVEDPQNLGAIIRTAEGAGVDGIIVPRHHAATVTPAVTRASAGAIAHLPLARVTNIAATLEELKEAGLWIVGTDAEGDRAYTAQDYRGPLAIVVGNEGRGMRRLVRERCDFLVRIPLYGHVESLNVSVAAAIVVFEAVRSRRGADAKPS